jgi:hypothetical protein
MKQTNVPLRLYKANINGITSDRLIMQRRI